MGFHCLLQFINILTLIRLSCFLRSIECNPTQNLTSFTPDIANSSASSEFLKLNSDQSREVKNAGSSQLANIQEEEINSESTDFAETNASKKRLRKNLLSSVVVPYVCDMEKRKCWLNRNQEHLVSFYIPIKLLPNKQPPAEIGLKELYSLVTKMKEQQMDNLDPSKLISTVEDQQPSSDSHRRRKRDTQYSEANDNSQGEWENQYENDQSFRVNGDQSYRAQRDVVPGTSTEHNPTSTAGRAQRNVTPLAKQSKRSAAEMEDDEVEDEEFGSPSPDDDYQQEDDQGNYQPEKRFSGPETAGTTPKPGESIPKSPSQPSRREVMSPNFNYPFFANPADFYYPSQRMLSPYDGISYRSADALPMQYMYANPGFWPSKVARNPQQYYVQRQAGGYGRGWPNAPPYYQPYANRYQSPYPSRPTQQNSGHYRHQYPQQSSYNSYKPFSYNYAQGNRNNKAPVRKPIETDADMYYGK